MRKLCYALCALFIITTAFNRPGTGNLLYVQVPIDTIPATPIDADTSIIFTEVDEEPKFKGDWGKFLMKNLNAEIPVNKRAPNGQYKIIIQFLVEKDGTTKNHEAVTRHGYGMEEECLRVLKSSGNWEPALRDGQPVRYYRKQPITFVISED